MDRDLRWRQHTQHIQAATSPTEHIDIPHRIHVGLIAIRQAYLSYINPTRGSKNNRGTLPCNISRDTGGRAAYSANVAITSVPERITMSSAFDLSVKDRKRKCCDAKPALAAEACHTRNEELSLKRWSKCYYRNWTERSRQVQSVCEENAAHRQGASSTNFETS
ncbi:hypothetical protein H101_00325 [Trichophyton interdigitale H6]|nr:hypothetical protein H101_00325 [Trichophyton interdigitale H6]